MRKGFPSELHMTNGSQISTVVCYGDSNTYGFDPRSFFGSRYPATDRWTDLLEAHSGWDVHCEGMNGRCIPRKAVRFTGSMDLLIIMLGTNDLLQGDDPATAAEHMEAFLKQLPIPSKSIVLIAPPHMVPGEWVTPELIRRSQELSDHYRDLAVRCNIRFVDAGQWQIPMCFDGVHFTEEGHRIFARKLWEELKGNRP